MDQAHLERAAEQALRDSVACLAGPSWMNPDGGIGRDPSKDSDLWSTAEALILACQLSRMNVVAPAAVDRMKKYVLESQQPDGSFASDVSDPDVVGTTLALMALWNWRDDNVVVAAADKGVAWLARNQNIDGGWDVTASGQNGGSVSTAFPTICAYEVISVWFLDNVGPIPAVQQAMNNAQVWLSTVRQPGGGIKESTKALTASVRHTAYAVLVDRAAGQLDIPGEATAHWLEQKQRRDGTWTGSTGAVESTAAAVRALLRLGAPPDSRKVCAALESLLEQRREVIIGGKHYSGWPTRPGGPPTSWPTYYALLALHDYIEALRTHPGKRTTIYFPRWRKVALLTLFMLLVLGTVSTVLFAGRNQAFAAALTTLVAMANIVVAVPLLMKWSQHFR